VGAGETDGVAASAAGEEGFLLGCGGDDGKLATGPGIDVVIV
jgi:hypothetical protein